MRSIKKKYIMFRIHESSPSHESEYTSSSINLPNTKISVLAQEQFGTKRGIVISDVHECYLVKGKG